MGRAVGAQAHEIHEIHEIHACAASTTCMAWAAWAAWATCAAWAGLDAAQILDEMPDLEADDLNACLMYARRRMDHPLIAA
jgi:hypothetical protein